MKIYLSSDHAGYQLKEKLLSFVKSLGYEAIDLGPFIYKSTDDYPDYIKLTGRAVSEDLKNARGIVLGASGQGEAIVANKFPGIRTAVYYGGNREIIKLSRSHNDANILSLGARFLNDKEAKDMVKLWLGGKFTDEPRHIRRIKKIEKIEKEIIKRKK